LPLAGWRTGSEIRLVRLRHFGDAVDVVLVDIFGADVFYPAAGLAPGHAGRPRRIEDLRILDRELDAQSLALIILIDEGGLLGRDGSLFADVAFLQSLGDFVIDHAVTLDDMERFTERRAELICKREGPQFVADRIHDESVAFIVSDRIPVPRGRDFRRMLSIQLHAADLVVLHEKKDDLVPLLN